MPVPRHWCFKRKYLQGKRGIEKPPFELPDFIKATGIMEMRQALQEKVRLGSTLLPLNLGTQIEESMSAEKCAQIFYELKCDEKHLLQGIHNQKRSWCSFIY